MHMHFCLIYSHGCKIWLVIWKGFWSWRTPLLWQQPINWMLCWSYKQEMSLFTEKNGLMQWLFLWVR